MNKLLSILLIVSANVCAQSVPAINTSDMSSPLLGQNQSLTAKEKHGLALAKKWINGTSRPITQGDGSVTYFYGTTMPQVVCAPLKTCDIQLQAGERITKKGVNIGDSVRWVVCPAISGEGATQITHIIVKPSDVGLNTTMVITTNKRTYNIGLSSRSHDWMPTINFDYPEEVQAEWDSYYDTQQQHIAEKTLGDGLNIDNLNFNYTVSGRGAFKPLRVYNNSVKTIIEMPSSINAGELPSLLVVNAGKKEIVNYRYRNNKFIVDQLAKQIVLIMGVGSDQQSVLITYKGK